MDSTYQAVFIPLLNANEPEAYITHLAVEEGQKVESGQLLCTLETTKANQELLAETGGYIRGLALAVGEMVPAGEILCYIAEEAEWQPPARGQVGESEGNRPAALENLRITKPALRLAAEHDLDLSSIPEGTFITESLIRELVALQEMPAAPEGDPEPLDSNKIVVYGAGGHGKAVIDLIRSRGIFTVEGVIDDSLPAGEEVLDVLSLGGRGALAALHHRGIRQAANAVGGIGDIRVRIRVFKLLEEAGFHCPAITHPSAVIEESAEFTHGAQVFPLAYIGTDSRIGFGVIVNTGAIVSHDCRLEDYVNISPGAILAGAVEIGSGTLVGMGVTINLGVRVGAGARIGNGATVKDDVPAGGLVPAGTIWPR